MHLLSIAPLLLAFASASGEGLTAAQAEAARKQLWRTYERSHAEAARKELDSRSIAADGVRMPIFVTAFGKKPAAGYSLWISMHGGGGAPKAVNDQQWENQKKLYQLEEGIYVAPRAPTDTWNLWHQAHIDALFARLIRDLVVTESVDPDRVYITGYSAGGDGTYQLAPRIADLAAGAAMMAGHPNETKPDGLRNVPFALHVGANDAGFDRNVVARKFGDELDALAAADKGGYVHQTAIHEGKGHWMDGEDAAGLKWLKQFRRNLRPERVVWLQDDVTHERFYWLAVPPGKAKAGSRVAVSRSGNTITVEDARDVETLIIRLDDQMFDLDNPVVVKRGEATLWEGKPSRSRDVLKKTLDERGDPTGMFCAEVTVPLNASQTSSAAPATPNIYSNNIRALDGTPFDMAKFSGKVALVVNVASHCGYTPQYAGLEALQAKYGPRGFTVIGFPCNDFGAQEPGGQTEIEACAREKFGATFPLMEKVAILDESNRSPIYRQLIAATGETPSWNFAKYLVDRDGRPLGFFPYKTKPDDAALVAAIEAALAAK